ncbi:MAG TPA: hypothetical protein VMS76_03990 [Planctomycetota bacterium]|nr:hypothetical protein [Planctomycetota bacterium]
MPSIRSLLVPALATLALPTPAARAGDAFQVVPLTQLGRSGEPALAEPQSRSAEPRRWARVQSARRWALVQPRVVLDTAGEAYLIYPEEALEGLGPLPARRMREPLANAWSQARLAVRAPEGQPVRGRLLVPDSNGGEPQVVTFQLPAASGGEQARATFLAAKAQHALRLATADLPGAAWFRRERSVALEELGGAPSHRDSQEDVAAAGAEQLDSTFDLFTGGRALAENLQLDRALAPQPEPGEGVPIDEIPGIDTRPLDWTARTAGLAPEPDPLAALVPEDQHAAFFPTLADLIRFLDEAERNGTPVIDLLEPRSEDARTRERYERQLCLPLARLAREAGESIGEVAITGSDPYLRAGSDVAVLLRTADPAPLLAFLAAEQQRAVRERHARATSDIDGGAPIATAISADRTVSSYVQQVGDAVLVANSLEALRRIAAVRAGSQAALAASSEYTFFRNRYPRGGAGESAFVILTDATIRRWCGPRWRIGDSRRTRAAAWLAEAQAAWVDALARGEELDLAELERRMPGLGRLSLGPGGVRSDEWGTLEFLTPIAELDLRSASQSEWSAYARFRDRYQQSWRQFFDPIAARVSLSGERVELDLSVLPLTLGTEYRDLMQTVGGARLDARAGDPHAESLLHVALALDTSSRSLRDIGSLLQGGGLSDPMSWVGGSFAIYADADPIWARLAEEASGSDPEAVLERHVWQLPLAMHVAVRDPLRLAAFLTGVRAMAGQAAPDLVTWENLTHADVGYVAIRAGEELGDEVAGAALHYVALPDALVLSLREDVLKRAIDRHLARKRGEPAAEGPWSGHGAGLSAKRGGLELLARMDGGELGAQVQEIAWANLPALNEWRRLFPEHDPLEQHERLWGTRLTCPGGGSYVWNERWHTYESTLYGHPAEPKPGPGVERVLRDVDSVQLGVTFEDEGLRARGVVLR